MDSKLNPSAYEALSPRERHVLDMATAGLIDKQICAEFDISINTLKTYWSRIREKVGQVPRSAIVSGYVTSVLAEDGDESPLMGYSGLVIDLETMLVSASDDVNLEHGFAPGERRALEEYRQMMHPEDRDRVMELLQSLVARQERVAHCVCRCIASGQPVPVSYTFRPEYDEEGKVTKICGFRTVSRDFANSAKLRVGFFESHSAKNELYIDDDIRAIHGIGPDDEADRNILFATIIEQDQERVQNTLAKAMDGEGGKQRVETYLRRKNGDVIPVTIVVSATRVRDGYRMTGTVSAVVD